MIFVSTFDGRTDGLIEGWDGLEFFSIIFLSHLLLVFFTFFEIHFLYGG